VAKVQVHIPYTKTPGIPFTKSKFWRMRTELLIGVVAQITYVLLFHDPYIRLYQVIS